MRTTRALLAGLIGALAMSIAMLLMRLLGFHIDLEALLGSIVVSGSYPLTWGIGFVIHLAFGALLGIFYAVAFEAVGHAGTLMGAGLGLANGLLAGMLMTSIPAMSPIGGVAHAGEPGAFLTNVHLGPVLFLVAHVVYGSVVGIAYGRAVSKPRLVHRGV
jgi:hypothetical protein